MATTQFDRIYQGLSSEVGSEHNFLGVAFSDSWSPTRIATGEQRHGLEGRRKRSSDSSPRRRDKMGPMVPRREELSAQSRAQGQTEGDV